MASQRSARKRNKRSKNGALTARTADKHRLYELSVQAPEVDTTFFQRYFKRFTGRPGRLFREDFCGTATLSAHWVALHRQNHAIGVDLDQPTLAWGREHNIAPLTEDQQSRIQLIRGDVREVREPKVDLTAALNFSYCVFKTRAELGSYLKNAHASLRPGGLFFMDSWGGSEAQRELEERRRVKGFTYVWDQARFDPISYHSTCKIHFEFRDGSRLRSAFVYDWRHWTLPELREALAEAGFRDVHILWEGTDSETDEGNGVFRRKERGEADLSWIAYVVGQR